MEDKFEYMYIVFCSCLNFQIKNFDQKKKQKQNIPYGLFLQLKRTAAKKSDFEVKTCEMHKRFIERGYKKRTLRNAYNKAKEQNVLISLAPLLLTKPWKAMK